MIVRLAMEEAGYEVQEIQVVQECYAAHEQFHALMTVDRSASQKGEPDAIPTAKREHQKNENHRDRWRESTRQQAVRRQSCGSGQDVLKPFELGDLVKAVEQELNIAARGLLNV